MKKLSLIGLLALTIAPVSFSETIFHCVTENSKQIALGYNYGRDMVTYTFGRNLNKPEITLQRSTSQVDVGQLSCRGGVVSLNNGIYSYAIYNDECGNEAGVTVSKGVNYLSNVKCKGKYYSDLGRLY